MSFELPPSQPPNFLRAGTKDPLSVPGVGREEQEGIKPVLSEFQAEKGAGVRGLLGSPPVSTGPAQAWGPGGGEIWETVLHLSPLFVLLPPPNGSFLFF